MAVGDQDPPKTVVRDALGNVGHEVEQMLDPNVDRAGKIHVVGFKAVGDQGQEENLAVGSLRGFLADVPDEIVVSVER